jgi:hypothetical protein
LLKQGSGVEVIPINNGVAFLVASGEKEPALMFNRFDEPFPSPFPYLGVG